MSGKIPFLTKSCCGAILSILNGAFLIILQFSETLWTDEIQGIFGHKAELPSPAVGLLLWEGVLQLHRIMIPATRANSWWLHWLLMPVILGETRGADENAVCSPTSHPFCLRSPHHDNQTSNYCQNGLSPLSLQLRCEREGREEKKKKEKRIPQNMFPQNMLHLRTSPPGDFWCQAVADERDDEEVGGQIWMRWRVAGTLGTQLSFQQRMENLIPKRFISHVHLWRQQTMFGKEGLL